MGLGVEGLYIFRGGFRVLGIGVWVFERFGIWCFPFFGKSYMDHLVQIVVFLVSELKGSYY